MDNFHGMAPLPEIRPLIAAELTPDFAHDIERNVAPLAPMIDKYGDELYSGVMVATCEWILIKADAKVAEELEHASFSQHDKAKRAGSTLFRLWMGRGHGKGFRK